LQQAQSGGDRTREAELRRDRREFLALYPIGNTGSMGGQVREPLEEVVVDVPPVPEHLGNHRWRQRAGCVQVDGRHDHPPVAAPSQCDHRRHVADRQLMALLPNDLDRLTSEKLGEHRVVVVAQRSVEVDPGGAVDHMELRNGRPEAFGRGADAVRVETRLDAGSSSTHEEHNDHHDDRRANPDQPLHDTTLLRRLNLIVRVSAAATRCRLGHDGDRSAKYEGEKR
jgi:hypothetical protein